MRGVDFFDVDHTLTRRSSGGRFIALAMQRGVLPRRLLFVVGWYAFTYKIGIFKLRPYAEGFPYLKGLNHDILVSIARESFESRLKDDMFRDGLALVRESHAAGRTVVLATSSLDIIVEPLARYIGVNEVLATTLEFKDGECTGRLAGPPMFRAEKKKSVLAYAADRGIALADCSFYSDSIYDLPLLEAVGRPVAVNPDFRLRRLARQRGWSIMDLA
jgi:HAD superfamily hydrolase (TIGR01490 family)